MNLRTKSTKAFVTIPNDPSNTAMSTRELHRCLSAPVCRLRLKPRKRILVTRIIVSRKLWLSGLDCVDGFAPP
jgi:hypothetical protein